MPDWDTTLVEIEVTDADVESVLDCLRSGWLTMGPRTLKLEERAAELVGTEHAVVVSSGTAALHLACRAVGAGPGDEVIVPAFTFVACAHAPSYVGAEPVLVDSTSTADGGISVEAVERAITPRTKAVMAVHMWGYPAAVVALRELCDARGIALIEDCAEAITARAEDGRPVGSVGEVGCFSFFSKKQLAVGEGGMVTTDDEALAASARSLRSHAMTSVTWERHKGHGLGYDITDLGYNYRMDEPRAALALSRLDRLEADVNARRAAARHYRQGLAEVSGVELMYDDDQVERGSHFVFPTMLADQGKREALKAELNELGVQTTFYPALHRLTRYADRGEDSGLPVASTIADRQLCLPLHAGLDEARVDSVVERVAEAARRVGV